jgi:hypothetical protein
MGTKVPAHACLHHWFEGREIHQKFGAIQIRTLRFVYGTGFAPAFSASHLLHDTLPLLDRSSLDKLLVDYKLGLLEAKIEAAFAQQTAIASGSATGFATTP